MTERGLHVYLCLSLPMFLQATSENIREFQEMVNQVKTEEIANFTSALTAGFELLLDSRNDPNVGANCNQAIMLVTDGVPYK